MHPRDIVYVGNTAYVIGRHLASGQIGSVFVAWRKDAPQSIIPDKVVKVPRPQQTEELQSRFWSELETLQVLNRKWREKQPDRPSPFLRADEGYKGDGNRVLVLEYVPDEAILSRRVTDDDTPETRERFFLQAALQYMDMLECLHEASYACPDRKTPDIRWLGTITDGHLVVLDWNVVTQNPPPEVIQEEYVRFGAMWYQFLTGKVPPPNLNVLDDALWENVSFLTRLWLQRLLKGYYKSDEAVRKDLQDAAQLWNATPESLNREAEKIKRYLQTWERAALSGRGQPENVGKEESLGMLYLRGVGCADVAWRKGGEQYSALRQKFAEYLRERGSRISDAARHKFSIEDYTGGLREIDELEKWLGTFDDLEIQLIVERWRTLLLAGKAAESDVSRLDRFQEIRGDLQEYTLQLQAGRGESLEEIEDIEGFPSFDKSEFPFLKPILLEKAIRDGWAAFRRKIAADSFAPDQYHQAWEILRGVVDSYEKLKEENSRYAQALYTLVMPDLKLWEGKIKGRIKAEQGYHHALQGDVTPVFRDVMFTYLQFRLADAPRMDEWKKSLNAWLEELEILAKTIADGTLPADDAVRAFLSRTPTEIWGTMNQEFQESVLWILQYLPFPNGLPGIVMRLEAANALGREGIPELKREKVRAEYIKGALEEIAELADTGSTSISLQAGTEARVFERVFGTDVSKEIRQLQERVKERLNVYEKIPSLLAEKRWQEAYDVAAKAGINIFDPLAARRIAQENIDEAEKLLARFQETYLTLQKTLASVEEAGKSIEKAEELRSKARTIAENLSQQRETIQSLVQSIEGGNTKLEQAEYIRRRLEEDKQAVETLSREIQQYYDAVVPRTKALQEQVATNEKVFRENVRLAVQRERVRESIQTIAVWAQGQSPTDIWIDVTPLQEAFSGLKANADSLSDSDKKELGQRVQHLLQSLNNLSPPRNLRIDRDALEEWKAFLQAWQKKLLSGEPTSSSSPFQSEQ